MPNFEKLFSKYDRLVLFDTETTGLAYSRDEIIEFAAVVVEPADGAPKIIQEYDELVSLSPGGFVPPKIEQLTGISTADIRERGLPKTRVCRDIAGKDKLDLLTVYRDRHSYPHKLCSAIEQYGLSGKVCNSHRAVDDVIATVAVMEEMEKEKDDLECYVNLFGYNPKYGIEGKAIGSVTYKPQPYNPRKPLYEM